MWYAVYEINDGTLISVGQVVASDEDLATKGFAKTEYAERPDIENVRWNPATLVFDVQPVYRAPISIGDILDLFTEAEREYLFQAYRQGLKPDDTAFTPAARRKIDAFIAWMQTSQSVSLDHPYFIASINTMETVEIIGVGRAAEILA